MLNYSVCQVIGKYLVQINEGQLNPDIVIIRKLVSVSEHLKLLGYDVRLMLNNNPHNALIAQLTFVDHLQADSENYQLSFYSSPPYQIEAKMDLVGFNISSNYTLSLDTQGLDQILESMIDEFAKEVVGQASTQSV